MITIKSLINKIHFDPKENPDNYVFFFEDRIQKKLLPLKFDEIEKIEGNFILVLHDNELHNIPLHRIKIVKYKNDIFWKRNTEYELKSV